MQAAFRESLLSMDDCCAITGEKTEKGLDAAHIVPVDENGADSPSNGILLRADIHRLYDARCFEVRQDGTIGICEEKSHGLSEEYRKILKSAKVSEKIISRVQEALAQRARLR